MGLKEKNKTYYFRKQVNKFNGFQETVEEPVKQKRSYIEEQKKFSEQIKRYWQQIKTIVVKW